MDRVGEFLDSVKRENLLRILHPAGSRQGGLIRLNGREYTDFSSNDYLGLSNHPRLKDAAKKAVDRYGSSSSASRLLSGDLELHHELEEETARFKHKESSLVFNSGYQANVGIIASLCHKGDVIFADRLSHASIIDGIVLSGARFFRFIHNDMEHLESLLKRERKRYREALIITETIFSMDGDRPPLKDLVGLKRRYDFKMMVDEAHATGIFGKFGSGIVEEEGLANEIEFIMGTFGKALGSFGAYLASSKKIAEYLVNCCRSFIYSTAPPPSVIAASLEGLNVIQEEPYRRKTLLENSHYFRKKLEKEGFETRGSSQIVPLLIGDSGEALNVAKELQKKGYWVLPVRPPTVPEGEARLRLSITYDHPKEMLDRFIHDIREIRDI